MKAAQFLATTTLMVLAPVTSAKSALTIQSFPEFQRRIANASMSAEEKHELNMPCGDLDSHLTFASLTRGKMYGVLEVLSKSGCDSEKILVFVPLVANWELASRIEIVSLNHHAVQISFPSLIESGVKEILIEHQEMDSGTGIFQLNTTIYKWMGGGMQAVFDAPEQVHYDEPQGESRYNVEQTSKFLVPADARSSASVRKPIVEQRIVRVNGSTIERWLEWDWDPYLQRFRSVECSPKCD